MGEEWRGFCFPSRFCFLRCSFPAFFFAAIAALLFCRDTAVRRTHTEERSILVRGSVTRIAAIAEPDLNRREAAARALKVPAECCFADVRDLWAQGKLADAAIIASMDHDHCAQVLRALELGYHGLLEKPISPDAAECMRIAQKAQETRRHVVVCHVLRYSPFFSKIKELIDSGEFGKVISIRLDENIGNFHFAHSFVRGNWRNAQLASPSIMQKSCHGMDLLNWLMGARQAHFLLRSAALFQRGKRSRKHRRALGGIYPLCTVHIL